MKKGQMTVFVVLGIVLIAVFGFAMLARTAIVKDQLDHQAQTLVKEAASQALNSYVSSCVEKVSQNGIKQMLLQGGYLYDYPEQKGPINISLWTEGQDYLPFVYNNQSLNVSYAVSHYENCNVTTPFLNPPWYPYPFKYLLNIQTLYTAPFNNCSFGTPRHSGFYGANDLSRLCNPNGPNKFQNASAVNYITQLQYTCDLAYFSDPGHTNMQDQLAYYIENHLYLCTSNLSDFNQRSGGRVTILNKPKVSVVYGNSSLMVKTAYPFVVNVDGKQVTTLYDFATPLNINFKGLYSCAFDLVKNDVQNIFFNKTLSFTALRSCAGFTYKEYREACPTCLNAMFDDVLEIQDPHSIIDGKPVSFLVSIKNRRPALEYIHNNTYYLYNTLVDLQFRENDTILLEPRGYDPDELGLTYNYSLWQEDYVDSFNVSCCTITNCSVNLSSCMVRDYSIQPHNWTNSTLFQTTKKDAAYKAQHGDAGLHEVNISVWDREGLVDYQIVRILVFDMPIAIINGTNAYADLNREYASVEDIYFLNASGSLKSTLVANGSFSFYQWSDPLEPFALNTTNESIRIPIEEYSINHTSLENIRLRNFTKIGTRNISLMITQQTPVGDLTSFPGYFELNVSACLPHRSSAASWPYNEVAANGYTPEIDPFQANHTCCYDGADGGAFGTIANATRECFFFSEYSSAYTFTALDRDSALTVNKPSYIVSLYPTDISDYTKRNDIYFRNFSRACSGARGNICSGDIVENILNSLSCTGDTLSFQTESCSGPSSLVPMEDSAAISCANYNPGESFEKTFNLPDRDGNSADGYCDNKYFCANGEGAIFNTSGPFACKAQCAGGGCNYPKDCICRKGSDDHGNMCTAALSCNGQNPGYAFSVTGTLKNESGCGASCQEITCAYYIFDPSTQTCLTSATSNAQCDDGYFKDDDNMKCVGELANSNKEDSGDTPDHKCEQVLGASVQCDEQAAPAILCSGRQKQGSCDAVCQYSNAGLGTCDLSCSPAVDPACQGVAPGGCGSSHRICTSACTLSPTVC